MKRPLIGIASDRLKRVPKYQYSIERAGGDVEVLLPDRPQENLWDHLDGLMLTGGGDIDASEFNEVNHPNVHGINKPRDEMELRLTREALQHNVPVFGICRGLQVMNVALGGNLIQHIPDEVDTEIVHDDSESSRQNLVHEIRIQEGTLLYRILGQTRIGVNSFHHQAIKELGKDFIETAWSDDGIVEGIEIPDVTFFLGVQWHPEEFVNRSSLFHPLFEAFVKACR